MSDTQTCYKCVPPREIGPGQIEGHNKDVHGGGKHLVPHNPKEFSNLADTQDAMAKVVDQ